MRWLYQQQKAASIEYNDIIQLTTKNEDKHSDNELLPKVALISTGGTIASKIDYRTGGVHAALSGAELYVLYLSLQIIRPSILMYF